MGWNRGPLRFVRDWGIGLLCVGVIVWAVVSGLDQDDPPPVPTTPVAQAPPDATLTQEDPATTAKLPVKQLFAESCGTCHTLTPAGTTAPIGPNLDERKLTADRVRSQIATGSIDGGMPANLLVGADADRVARYVAKASGSRR